MSGRLAGKPTATAAGTPEPPAPDPLPPMAATELSEASRELLDYLIESTWDRCLRDLRDARGQRGK